MQAYILITTQASQVKSALEALRKISGVKRVDAVTGPFDLVAFVEGKDMKTIGELVVSEIQDVPGVARTITCLVVDA